MDHMKEGRLNTLNIGILIHPGRLGVINRERISSGLTTPSENRRLIFEKSYEATAMSDQLKESTVTRHWIGALQRT